MKLFELYILAKWGSKHDYTNCIKRIKEETDELEYALVHESKLNARIEAGDVCYYLVYYLFLICERVNLNPEKLIEVAVTKVSSRRKNGKKKSLEKKLVKELFC
jgi:NTP pyrophosphatase (non-canonical NTP hydrolase)